MRKENLNKYKILGRNLDLENWKSSFLIVWVVVELSIEFHIKSR